MRWITPALGPGIFVAAVLATLIAFAPATLIDARLASASDGRLRLAGADGTIWSGAGWIEVRDAHGRAGVARRIAWRVLPETLLRARLVAEIELDQAKPFRLAISLSRVEIADAGINLPAAALGLGMPKLAPLRLTGEVRVSIPHLSLERGRMDGDATLQWRAAGPEAEIKGYTVVMRPTTSPYWEQEIYVGKVNTYTLKDVSIDDAKFGVKAIGVNGAESLVTSYAYPPRQNVEIETVQ